MNSTIETGNVHRHVKAPGKLHSQNGRRILIAALVIASVGIFISSSTVVEAAVPWYVTVGETTIAGAAIGGAFGGPIGAVGGAIAGAAVGALIAYQIGHSAKGYTPSVNMSPQIQDQIIQAYNTISETENIGFTTSSLVNTSYYYFAQEVESFATRYINTSLNQSELMLMAGIYAQLDGIQISVVRPMATELMFLQQYELENYAGASSTEQATFVPAITNSGKTGNSINLGDYYYLNQNNSIYFWTSGYVELKNIFTGNITNVSASLSSVTDTTPYIDYNTVHYVRTVSGSTIINALYGGINYLSTSKRLNLTGSIYQVVKENGIITTDGLSLGSNWNGQIQNYFTLANTYMFVNMNTASNSLAEGSAGIVNTTSSSSIYQSATSANNYNALDIVTFGSSPAPYYISSSDNIQANISLEPYTNMINTLNTAVSNAYSSAEAYITMLRDLGYTNYSQIPANETIPFPSWSVPLSLLNNHFNETQLMAMYYAYLESLNATFHNNNNKLPANWTFNDTKFLNSFTIETGILNITNSFDGYHNITGEFMIETNSQHMNFAVGHTTKFTALTPIVAINATLGDPTYISGDLIEASPNSTIYVTALSVNGTSVTSTSIYPAPITVVISPFVSPVTQHNGGFFMQKEGPLATWEWILIGLISVVAVAAIFERRD